MINATTFNLHHGVREGRLSLDALNSLTKYPSIPTYHALGAKGILREWDPDTHERVDGVLVDVPPVVRFVGDVEVTEKIDGTNARVIVLPDRTVLVGSREELLWASGDLLRNPALGIVDALARLDVAVAARVQLAEPDRIRVVYGEVYGAGVGQAGKRYAGGERVTGFRVFDVASVPVEALAWTAEQAASWRQRGGQRWESRGVIRATADYLRLERVPSLAILDAKQLPQGVETTGVWLGMRAPRSRAVLSSRDGELVRAEGVVLRGRDAAGERLLAKVRFEDYERTLKARARAAA